MLRTERKWIEREATDQREGRCPHKQSPQTVTGATMDKPGCPEVSVSQIRARQRAPHSPIFLAPQIPQTTQIGLQTTTL